MLGVVDWRQPGLQQSWRVGEKKVLHRLGSTRLALLLIRRFAAPHLAGRKKSKEPMRGQSS
jgi:hypothetical protein